MSYLHRPFARPSCACAGVSVHVRDMTEATPGMRRVPLVYVGGTGRGGSTLLSAVLGMLPQMVSVGELRGIWGAIQLNELCGCGEQLGDCPFWTEVGQRAFGGWDGVDVGAARRADESLCRHRSLPLLVSPTLPASKQMALEEHLRRLERLYLAIHDVAGAESVILDSTKDAPYALLLRKVGAIEMRVIHLIRDSRAVAFSWARRVPRPEYVHIEELRHSSMNVLGPARAAIEWDVRHALFTALAATGSPSYRLSYESFAEAPADWMSSLARWFGWKVDGHVLDALRSSEYESEPHHTVGGNRIRFRRGSVPIRVDDAWLAGMTARERLLVTALTAPLLKRYGYSLRPGAS